MLFAPTIDVEGTGTESSYETVDLLGEHLAKCDVTTTLFVTPDVVEAKPDRIVEFLDSGHQVGLHLHPERLGYATDWLTDYSAEEIKEMLLMGLETFAETISHRPTAFRAGRWQYSEQLLEALAAVGLRIDASLRPNSSLGPYESAGILELPLSVYDNVFLQPILSVQGFDLLPLHADALLSKRRYVPAMYWASWRLRQSERPYLMIGYHDYDLTKPKTRRRIESYLNWMHGSVPTVTLETVALRSLEGVTPSATTVS